MTSPVTQRLEALWNQTILDGEGNSLECLRHQPASEEDIQWFERNWRIDMPDELRALVTFANGMKLHGLEFLSLEDMMVNPLEGTITFHAWGNGDFDALVYNADTRRVVFMNHRTGDAEPVADSMDAWLDAVSEELQAQRTLHHPGEYAARPEQGVYHDVFNRMRAQPTA